MLTSRKIPPIKPKSPPKSGWSDTRHTALLALLSATLGAVVGATATITVGGFAYLNRDRELDLEFVKISLTVLGGEISEESKPARRFALNTLSKYSGVEIPDDDFKEWVNEGVVPNSEYLRTVTPQEQSIQTAPEVTANMPRGIRNHNPMNLSNNSNWLGIAKPENMMSFQKNETVFAVFESPLWGIRAGTKLLLSYYDKYQNRNLRDIIYQFHPVDKEKYLKYISNILQVDPEKIIENFDRDLVTRLVSAIITVENGMQPYDLELISQGVSMAFEDR